MHKLPTVRPMTQVEKQQLRLLIEPNLLSGANWRMGATILVLFAGAILWVSLVAVSVMHGFSQNIATILLKATPIIAVAISLLIYYKVLRTWTPRAIIRRSTYARDYRDAVVHVYQYAAVRALLLFEGHARDLGIIEELVDTSQHREAVVVDIGNGRLLFLHGAYLKKLVTDQRFPSSQFNVIRLPNVEETLAIQPLGPPLDLKNIQIISNVNMDMLPDDLTEITGRFSEMAAELCIR